MAGNESRRWSLQINPSDLALEIISIVIAIVLATFVGQMVTNHQAGVHTREALQRIRREIVDDEGTLRGLQSLHQRAQLAFAETVRRTPGEQLSFDRFERTFGDAAPTGFHPFAGTTTAWELARGSNVLADVPYGLRATLQTRYAELAQLQVLNTALMSRLETAPGESRPNFYFTAVAVSEILVDLVYSEKRLARDDDAALRELESAGIR